MALNNTKSYNSYSSLWENPFPGLSSFQRAARIPWLMAPFHHLQSQQWLGKSFSNCITLTSAFVVTLPFKRTLNNYIGPTRIIQDKSPLLKILNQICKVQFAIKKNSGLQIRTWISLGSHYSAYHKPSSLKKKKGILALHPPGWHACWRAHWTKGFAL